MKAELNKNVTMLKKQRLSNSTAIKSHAFRARTMHSNNRGIKKKIKQDSNIRIKFSRISLVLLAVLSGLWWPCSAVAINIASQSTTVTTYYLNPEGPSSIYVLDDKAYANWSINGNTVSFSMVVSGERVLSVANSEQSGPLWDLSGRLLTSSITVDGLGPNIIANAADGREGAGGFLRITSTGTGRMDWGQPEGVAGADSAEVFFPKSFNYYQFEVYGNAGAAARRLFGGYEQLHRYIGRGPEWLAEAAYGGLGFPLDGSATYSITTPSSRGMQISQAPVLFDTTPALAFEVIAASAAQVTQITRNPDENGEGGSQEFVFGTSTTKVDASFKIEQVAYDPTVSFTGFIDLTPNASFADIVQVRMDDPWNWYDLRIPGKIDNAFIMGSSSGGMAMLPLLLDKPRQFRNLTAYTPEMVTLDLSSHTLTLGNRDNNDFQNSLHVRRGDLTLMWGLVDTKGVRVGGTEGPTTLVLADGSKVSGRVLIEGKAGSAAKLNVQQDDAVGDVIVSDYGTLHVAGGVKLGSDLAPLALDVGARTGFAMAEFLGHDTEVRSHNMVIGSSGRGGSVQVLDGAYFQASEVTVGGGGGEGELLLDGEGSLVRVRDLLISGGYFHHDVTNYFSVGSFGKGSVSVLGGSQMEVTGDLYVGPVPFTEGRLKVSGSGSKITTRNLYMGEDDPALIVRPGWIVSGGPAAQAHIEISAGGVLEVTRAVNVIQYPAEDIQHSIVVSGSRSEFRASGLDVALQNVFTDINQGGQFISHSLTYSGNQMFRVRDADSLWEGEVFKVGLLGTPGHVEVLNGGHLRIGSTFELGLKGGQSSLRIDGNGSVVELQTGYMIAGLREPTRTNTQIEHFVGAVDIVVSNGGELIAPEIFLGPLSTLGGRDGKVTGHVYSLGLISPGSSPGTMTIDGDLTLLDGGWLKLEIAGLSAGSLYDQLIVTGDLNIDGGAIELAFIDGFKPLAGQSFKLLEVHGAFSGTPTFRVKGLADNWRFGSDFNAQTGAFTLTSLSDGVATAVPEPSSALLFGLGLLGLGGWRRYNPTTA